jgi:hypothetical protein
METTFHFSSAQEITADIVEAIKQAYKKKPVSIHIQEEYIVPDWQIQEVRRRNTTGENFLDCDTVIDELERELEMK